MVADSHQHSDGDIAAVLRCDVDWHDAQQLELYPTVRGDCVDYGWGMDHGGSQKTHVVAII